mmetsp:Transcript_8381/g.35022  ORF Transcript_8381/g.35022 Transcript_8381/m.35022 type:complete len:332 (+) Transcript_8381:9281-10276(+)
MRSQSARSISISASTRPIGSRRGGGVPKMPRPLPTSASRARRDDAEASNDASVFVAASSAACETASAMDFGAVEAKFCSSSSASLTSLSTMRLSLSRKPSLCSSSETSVSPIMSTKLVHAPSKSASFESSSFVTLRDSHFSSVAYCARRGANEACVSSRSARNFLCIATLSASSSSAAGGERRASAPFSKYSYSENRRLRATSLSSSRWRARHVSQCLAAASTRGSQSTRRKSMCLVCASARIASARSLNFWMSCSNVASGWFAAAYKDIVASLSRTQTSPYDSSQFSTNRFASDTTRVAPWSTATTRANVSFSSPEMMSKKVPRRVVERF